MQGILRQRRPSGMSARIGWAVWLLLCSCWVQAETLQDVRYQGQVGGQLELEFQFDGPPGQPQILLAADPAQLRLNFSGADADMAVSRIPIGSRGVNDLQVLPQADGLQVVIGLQRMLSYRTRIEGDRYYVILNDQSEAPATAGESGQSQIEAIDFHRGEAGAGELVVTLNSARSAANLQRIGADLVVTLYNSTLPDELLYVVNVEDFNTQVVAFETFREANNSQVRLDMGGQAFDYDYRQEGNRFVVTVQEQQAPVDEEKTYTGSQLSMNFQDIEVRTVLQIIADHNNFNLVTTDTVQGSLTLHLDDVPWDQALDMILKVNGLDKRIEGNILLVAPRDELAAQENQQLRDQQEAKEVAPLFSEYVQIHYAKASDIANLLSGEAGSLLSERGAVSVDERTNTLLVQDTAERLEDVHRLVEVLDIPIKQVVIESRMVTIRDNINEELGIRWGVTDQQGNKGTSGTLEGANDIANGIAPAIVDRLNVNLPVSEPAGSIAFHVAKLNDGTLLDLELSALERENKGEIIASPRLTTANQFTAFIEQGVEIPFVQSTSSGATSVEFKKAVLGLTVKPQITPDNRIVLDLTVTQDTRGETVQTATGPATAIDTQRISTQVLAKNGETIVLGGIFQQQQLNNVSKVPVLGDIPWVGWFFRNTSDFVEKKELLIFVTPKVVTEEL
ncbi:type IV pilus assembly protein PilQ [Ferrimonas marina]|uniref:Type IV pilus assembly protein PilQ n=2 Tax=Ferrimonas marina TaxID=299255 RepID=A0A1M5XHJ0_9GAMM|nr:type IV pilus assembly protein PilQ [Ferrimonas marina]